MFHYIVPVEHMLQHKLLVL